MHSYSGLLGLSLTPEGPKQWNLHHYRSVQLLEKQPVHSLPRECIDGPVLVLSAKVSEKVFITQIFEHGINGISHSPGKKITMFTVIVSQGKIPFITTPGISISHKIISLTEHASIMRAVIDPNLDSPMFPHGHLCMLCIIKYTKWTADMLAGN